MGILRLTYGQNRIHQVFQSDYLYIDVHDVKIKHADENILHG